MNIKKIMGLLGVWVCVFMWIGYTPAFAQIDVNQIGLAVVQITVYVGDDAVSTGSGTLVTRTGMIFTNWHVVDGGDDFEIALLEDVNELPVPRYYASVLNTFEDIDFAVLQIDRNLRGRAIDKEMLDLPFIPLGLDPVSRGDSITVFGYPGIGGGFLVVTNGSITTIQNGRVNGVSTPVIYQTNAELAPGNSGGAAVNSKGELIGIPFYVSSENRTGGRLGEIIPITLIAQVIENKVNQIEHNTTSNTTNTVTGGVDVDCGRGIMIDDGIEVTIVQMRSGFSYTVTIIGLNGFSPLLGIITEFGTTACVNTPAAPAMFAVNLPSTGEVTDMTNSIQYTFSQNTGQNMADMRLIVGGMNGTFGEFLLILEGMAFNEFDGRGDPIAISATPRLLNSAVPMSVYMIGIPNALDPYFFLYDRDNPDNPGISCDDAGVTNLCLSGSFSLVGSYITRANQTRLSADRYDAMMSIPFSSLPNLDKSKTIPLIFLMASSNYASYGHYIFALHASSR